MNLSLTHQQLASLNADQLRALVLLQSQRITEQSQKVTQQSQKVTQQSQKVTQQEQLLSQHNKTISDQHIRIKFIEAVLAKTQLELSVLRRVRFSKSAESFTQEQKHLFDETVDGDTAQIEEEMFLDLPEAQQAAVVRTQPKRKPLPPQLPRTEIRHEPKSTTCSCGCHLKRMGEDVSEKLDYVPGTFSVERHIRGKVGLRCM